MPLNDGFKPTAGMKEEAQRGLDWRAEFGRGGTAIGIARARDIINGKNLPIETVRRMHSYFSRHEVDKKAEGFRQGEEGFPSAGRIAWALWGGDAGQSWARQITEAERQSVATNEIGKTTIRREDPMTETITYRELPPSYRPADSEDVPVSKPACATCEYFCMVQEATTGEFKPFCERWKAAVEPTKYCDAYEAVEEEEGDKQEISPTATEEDAMPIKIETNSVAWLAVKKDDKRSIAYSNLEFRSAEEDGNIIVGYAAVWDSPSEPMPFIEYVKRGAFTKTLKDGADVRLLIDHTGVPLARTKSGTMTLTEDDRGLRVEAALDPTNPDAARVMSAMRRGDLSQMSFAFRTIKDSWSDNGDTRELREVQLFDVSVVTFPAYEETVAELRSRTENANLKTNSQLRLRQQQIALAKYRSR